MFEGASNACRRCQKTYACDVCQKRLPSENFEASQLHNYGEQNMTLRCTPCMTCSKCQKTFVAKMFEGASNACRQCQQTYACDVCQKKLPRQNFEASQLHHYGEQNMTLRCIPCMTCSTCKKTLVAKMFEGTSNACRQCQQTYVCAACDEMKTKTHFNADDIKNAKRRNAVHNLICIACKTVFDQTSKKINARKSWRCKCPNQSDDAFTHSSEKCPLKPSQAGQKRWPGSNNGVKESDYLIWRQITKRRKVGQ